MLNICGCLVQTAPDRTGAVLAAFAQTEGCEVHAEDRGRIVITVEDTPTQRAADIIMALHQISGVLGITLTYHHFEAGEPAPRANAA